MGGVEHGNWYRARCRSRRRFRLRVGQPHARTGDWHGYRRRPRCCVRGRGMIRLSVSDQGGAPFLTEQGPPTNSREPDANREGRSDTSHHGRRDNGWLYAYCLRPRLSPVIPPHTPWVSRATVARPQMVGTLTPTVVRYKRETTFAACRHVTASPTAKSFERREASFVMSSELEEF